MDLERMWEWEVLLEGTSRASSTSHRLLRVRREPRTVVATHQDLVERLVTGKNACDHFIGGQGASRKLEVVFEYCVRVLELDTTRDDKGAKRFPKWAR